jgi:hypothetical protein
MTQRRVAGAARLHPDVLPWQRRAYLVVGLAVLTMAALATLAGATLETSSGNAGAWSVPLGAYTGAANPQGIADFAASTGTTPSYASDYLPWQSGWSAMSDASSLSWLLGPWSSTKYTLVLGVPMIPNDASGVAQGTLAQGAAGAYDSYFATLAATLVAGGEPNAVLRIGWEFNGNWYPWSVTDASDAANYVTYFDRIVTAMRSVPGQAFKFAWNPNNLGSFGGAYTPDQTYPGDAYVDYVGTDVFDECWCSPQDPQNAWASQLPGTWGLDWLAGFAGAHGKPIAIPEWGVAIRSDGHGLADDPYFVSQFGSWIAQNNVAFTSYFDFDAPDGTHDLFDGNFPNSLAAFQSTFDAPPGTPAPTTTVPAPTSSLPPTTTSTSPAPSSPPLVMVVMMENQGYGQIIGNSAMPYTNSLATDYGSATASYALAHPSLPNYLAIASGSNQGVTVDEPPSSSGVFGVPTLATQLASARISMKAYAENLPADPTNDSGLYAVRHFPWEYFRNPPPIADAASLITDLNSTSAPSFVWYTPNLTNDGHTGTPVDNEQTETAQSDSFLSSLIPSVQATTWYQAGGQIIIEWDEAFDSDTSGIQGGWGGQVPTIVVSNSLKASPARDSQPVDTVGILHSIEDAYRLPHLNGSSADGTIDSLLSAGSTTPPTTTPPTTTPPTTTPPTTTPPTTTPPTTTPPTTTPPTTTPPTTTPPTTTPPTTTPPSTSPPGPPLTPTSIRFSLQPATSSPAEILTWEVSPHPGGGTVSFSVDGWQGDLPVAASNGRVSLALFLEEGTHTVFSTYSGFGSFASSTTASTFSAGQAPTELVVAAPVQLGSGNTFSMQATLTSQGVPVPDAPVWFAADGNELCQGTTDGSGDVTCTLDEGPTDLFGLMTGSVSATFGGDVNHMPVVGVSPEALSLAEDAMAHIRMSATDAPSAGPVPSAAASSTSGAGAPVDGGAVPSSVPAGGAATDSPEALGAEQGSPTPPLVDAGMSVAPASGSGGSVLFSLAGALGFVGLLLVGTALFVRRRLPASAAR